MVLIEAVAGLYQYTIGQVALDIGRKVLVQINRAFLAVVINNINPVLSHSRNYTGLLCKAGTKFTAHKGLYSLAAVSVYRLYQWHLALKQRDCLRSVLGVVCYYSVSYSVDVVIGIEVYHIARCWDLNNSDDCIYYAVAESRLRRYQLQRQ